MRNARKLSLKRESLSELSTNDLVAVAGGQALTHLCGPTDGCTHGPSFDERCPTIPINYCITRAIATPHSLLDCIATY